MTRILPDSSIWIDLLLDRRTPQTDLLRSAAADHIVLVGDLVTTEVLQGVRTDRGFAEARSLLASFEPVMLCGSETAIRAAANYRLLRQRGITVRGTIDVIVATWCIENDVPIIHNDRDMAVMERELGLRAYA